MSTDAHPTVDPLPSPAAPPSRTVTVVWYSYKGGVGRSMCLANVCSLLLREGCKVGVIDLDLEAPGLNTIAPFHDERDRSVGVLGFLADIVQDKCTFEKVRQYVWDFMGNEELHGKLLFMRAGPPEMAEYLRCLGVLREQNTLGTGTGQYLIDGLRDWFAQEWQPDYLLIDARTGFSETGGVSALNLADLLVLHSGLNENNLAVLTPLLEVLAGAHRDGKAFLKRVIPVLLQASAGETEWSGLAFASAERALSGCLERRVRIPPWTGAPYRAGDVVSQKWVPPDLAEAYCNVMSAIVRLAMQEIRKPEGTPAKQDDDQRRLAAAEALVTARPNDPIARAGFGELLAAAGEKDRALAELQAAARMAPANPRVVRTLADHLSTTGSFAEADEVYQQLLVLIADREPSNEYITWTADALFNAFAAWQGSNDKPQAQLRRIEEQCREAFQRFFPRLTRLEDIPEILHPACRRLLQTRGRCLDGLKDLPTAEEVFATAVRLFPDSEALFSDLITFLSNNERYDRALEECDAAVNRGVPPEVILGPYVGVLLMKKRIDASFEVLQRFRPLVAPGRWNLVMGELFWHIGRHDPAIAAYRKAAEQSRERQERQDALVRLAERLWATDRNSEAIDVANQLVAEFNAPAGRMIRVQALVDLKPYRYVNAENQIEVKQSGIVSPSFFRCAALAAAELGELDLAEQCYKRLLKIEKLDGSVRARALARYAQFLARYRPGRIDEALCLLKQARQLATDLDVVRAADAVVKLHAARVQGVPPARVDLTLLAELCRGRNDVTDTSDEELWPVLESVFREGDGTVNRWIAGATLAASLIKGDQHGRASDVIGQLQNMETPDGFDLVFNNLLVRFFGMAGRGEGGVSGQSIESKSEKKDQAPSSTIYDSARTIAPPGADAN